MFGADGHPTGHSTSNIFGGHDLVDAQGSPLGHTAPEPGGMSIHDATGVHHATHNIFGGWDIHNG